jgi:hypothetical protein
MIRAHAHKLVHRPGDVSELFDLVNDPCETLNHHGEPEYAKIQSELEARLLDWHIHTSDVTPYERQNRGYPEGLQAP